MAVLGKRKTSSRSEPTSEEALSAEEIFRRHFEAQFAPLEEDPAAKRQAVAQDDDEEDSEEDGIDDEDEDEEEEDEDDEWGGLSDDEISASDNDVAVEVIDHSTSQPKTESMSKADLKAFMVSYSRLPFLIHILTMPVLPSTIPNLETKTHPRSHRNNR